MNSNNRIAAKLYSLGTQFCLRNISINTLHKGDDDDNNSNNNHNNNNCHLRRQTSDQKEAENI